MNIEMDVLLYLALTYPIVQILGTIRHEASHALAAKMDGCTILKFVVLPSISSVDGLRWGYIQTDRQLSKTALLMPYYVALSEAIGGIFLCAYLYERMLFFWWGFLALNVVVSPCVDILYNYIKGKRGYGDFARAREL